jgi:23S rRNA (cytidine1920-2'-O)/16S rRNA (cytidine1409-2'-O)-methyltransferase
MVATRQQAASLIARGSVLVGGSVADKPARLVAAAEAIELTEPPAFVGRGGEKLRAALDRFHLDVRGLRALDAGASTGGFTDCLLQAGAASVVAVDVGHGQLHERLRGDVRVTNRERLDIRDVTLATMGGVPVEVVCADLSFISVARAVPVLVGEVAVPGSPVVILVKPQFEAGRVEASRGRGVIRDPEIHRRTLGEVASALGAAGAAIMGAMPSPITGSAGNIEFLLYARTPSDSPDVPAFLAGTGPSQVDALLDDAVAEAHRTDPGG